MEYICDECERIFNEPRELKNMGGDIGESLYVCPYCGSQDYSEAVECAICGDILPEHETTECVCEKCLNHFASFKHALKLGEKDREFIQVNGFLWFLLGDEQDLERILRETVNKRYLSDELESLGADFCREDDFAFADYLKRRGVFL